MNKKTIYLLLVVVLLGSWKPSLVLAAGGHDGHGSDAEHAEEAEDSKGPNGGKLLQQNNFAVELTIVEGGIPSEMRLFAYLDGKLIDPALWQAEITLDRLGGDQDVIGFAAEGNYLLGNQVIREPHSYEVTLEADYQGREYQWHYQSFEGRTEINDRQLQLAGLEWEVASAQILLLTDTLFGVIAAAEDQVFRVHAPYKGLVKQVHVNVGDRVSEGQTLLTVTNTDTLQAYTLVSPAAGEVTQRMVNPGDRADATALLEVVDLSQVWVEMSAFPESIEKLAVGQTVTVRDLHNHETVNGKVSYVAPQMTGGHIARTRAVIDNSQGHWRPGMHIEADIQLAENPVSLAVRKSAIQSFRDRPVVFAKFGNTFEVRMVELGIASGQYVEVLGGLKAGTEYVIANSYLIKADILKSGASHDH